MHGVLTIFSLFNNCNNIKNKSLKKYLIGLCKKIISINHSNINHNLILASICQKIIFTLKQIFKKTIF